MSRFMELITANDGRPDVNGGSWDGRSDTQSDFVLPFPRNHIVCQLRLRSKSSFT